ncbi:MAG: hypothetical protein J7L45_00605 [Candidatus Aenigmarchaeota archaeon]|nr:hypothetical protein [Candidatus Aenigmarchaeota archaeon]
MDPIIKDCFEEAKSVLKNNEIKIGLKAGSRYPDMWFRDALISSIGMVYSGDEHLTELAKKILDTSEMYQKWNGQIPNKVSEDGERICFGESGSLDPTIWYIIAVTNYYKVTEDIVFLKKKFESVKKALNWILYMDLNNDFLIEATEGEDWNDWLIRSGRILYDNVLFFKSLKSFDEMTEILGVKNDRKGIENVVRNHIDLFFWPKKENEEEMKKKFSFSYINKDIEIAMKDGTKPYYIAEVGFRKYDPRCDVYANTLSILFGVANEPKTKSILNYFQREKVFEPYPVRILVPPVDENDPFRTFYFRETDFPYTQKPGYGQNGGVWPYVGGFYVLMLKKLGLESNDILKKLAEVNIKTNFNEWLDWHGTPHGSENQSWNAATYILAYAGRKVKL